MPGPSSTRAGAAARACNALPDPVATGDIVVVDGPVPAGIGGDIVDGTYVFTGGSYYGGAAGAPAGTVLVTLGSTVVLNAGSYDEISLIQGQTDTSSGTISFVDTTAASTSTCPDVASGSGDYTFDGATLTLYGPDSAETYALQ